MSTTLLSLVGIPATRPVPVFAGDRSVRRAQTGRIIIVSSWLVRAGAAGALALLVTENFDNPGFHAVPAVIAVAGRVLAGARVYGRHLAGFVGERTKSRVGEVPRKVLGIAVTGAVAGFATDLANIAEAVFEEGPGRLFGYLHNGWGMPGFFAVLLTIVVCLVAAVVIAFVGGVLQRALAAVFGEGNDLGAWLEKTSPVKYVRGYDFRQFYFKFIITLHGTWWATPSDVARERGYRQMLKSTGPLVDEAYSLLTERVLTAVLPLLPSGCHRFRVNLHVAGDHEEIILETEGKATDAEPPRTRRLLNGFERAPELRRLRAGVPFPDTVIFTTYCEAQLPDQVVSQGTPQWSEVERPDFGYSAEEPEWFTPPSRDQYAWELKRWPIFDEEIPYWLRDRLLPGPAYARR
ncbi:MAG: hypothetical protein ACRDO1_02830 [Nocardioidaceae bacterium]